MKTVLCLRFEKIKFAIAPCIKSTKQFFQCGDWIEQNYFIQKKSKHTIVIDYYCPMELTVYQNLMFEPVMNILFLDKVRCYKQLIP